MSEFPIRAYDLKGNRHTCMDGTAVVVNDRWVCHCPGGPFYVERNEAIRRGRDYSARFARLCGFKPRGV